MRGGDSYMDKSKISAALYTVALVFAAAFVGQMMTTGFDVFNLDISAVEAAINAGISAAIVLFVNYANPKVTRYGVGS